MVARIQIRRDTAADWTSANPVLSAGELGWESDTSKIKIGDGSTNWQSLGYTVFPPSFADLSGKPTTVAGYGITDALTSVAFADLTSKPTTVAGYGITDALTQVAFSDLVNKPTTIGGYGITDAFNGAFSSLTGRPTTISGYGITDAFSGAFSALTGKPTTIAGYGITDAFNGSFTSLTNKPTTISGYGITDSFAGTFAALAGKPTTLAGYGITDSFSGAFSSLTGTPTTLADYGITDAAPKASPALTGVPTAPTATLTTSTTQIATTSFAAGKVQEAISTSNRIIFQDSAPSFTAFGEIWLDTNGGGLYKSAASTTIVPLDSGEVSTSSSSITIPAQGASDTRLVLDTSNSGLPNGSVSLTTPLFLEVFSSTGVNQPSIGTLTYHDDTTQAVNSNSYSRSSGNHFDKKVKSFTYYSAGTANTGNSYITLTVSGIPAWEIQSADTQTQINAVIDGAPGALDTLNELAAAINDDASFASTVTSNLATKAPLASPSLTGTPTAPTASAGTNTSQIATTAFVKGATDGLSVSTGSASGGGSLSFSSGVFTFAPADLSSIAFSAIQSKPTTVSGYGITDALTTGADADIGSNDFITTGKVYFANKFNNVSDLPSATTYHGMFAHVHATGAAYFAHGGNWIELTNKADTNVVSIGGTAPSSPAAGDLWFDSGNLNLYVYYNDGSSNQWVQTTSTAADTPAITSDGATPSLSSGITAAEIKTLLGVTTDISAVVDGAPTGLDTLNELAAAINDDANFHTTITNALAGKAALASPALTGAPTAPTASSNTNTTQIATTAFVQQEIGTPFVKTDLSVTTGSASGGGSLSYNNSTGVFTFVPSAFGFSGVFADLTSKPTTIAGYGITDAFDGAYSSLTGIPTTIAHKNADIDIGSNDFITTGKVLFANMYSATSDLPSATTYHGMFAHVHGTGAAYFAHAGNWVELANKAYVDTQVTALVDSAPATLNTLNELAAALNDDASFSTTVTSNIALKAPLSSPALTGTPTAPTASSGTNSTQLATTAFVQAAVSGSGSYNDAAVDTHLNRSTASSGEVLSWTGSDYDWVAQSGGGGGASVTVSETAPSSPSSGDLWFDPSVLKTFLYYQDGSSNQWVQTNPSGAGGSGGASVSISETAPTSPSAGDLWFDPSILKTFIYYQDGSSNQWVQTNPSGSGSSSGGGGLTTSEKTSSYTAVANDQLIVDCSGGAVTVTLPSSANLGDEVRIIDGTGNANTNNITIARNGHKIQGATSDLTVSTERAAFGLVYYNAAQGWLLTER